MRKFSILSVLAICLCFNFYSQKNKATKLVVGIVVDQMCYDYLHRFQAKFSANGFNKILKNGTNCVNTVYSYVPTYTGPGHATIYTGTTPSNHGIVGNEWFHRNLNQINNCVKDSTVKSVGGSEKYGQRSPHHLKSITITDQLKLTYPSAKVISISLKDRSAILPGGSLSNGSYWFDFENGNMITSTFYTPQLPQWVNAFNQLKKVDGYLQKKWETLAPIDHYSAKDESLYEATFKGKTSPTFPYDLASLKSQNNPYQLFSATPFANEFLTDFTIKAIENEHLGKDNQCDFLCLSYSSPDIIGHQFGPYSVEIEDTYLRLDQEIAKLLTYLESSCGKDGFTLFLTADHAVVPVPQMLVDLKLPGGYLYLGEKIKQLKTDMFKKYGEHLILEECNNQIYLDRDKIKQLNINQKNVEREIAEYIGQWKEVKLAIAASDLDYATNDWAIMLQKGYDSKRSGDVLFLLNPGYLEKDVENENAKKGTSHGSAFNYDTHVPLLWYGNQIGSQIIYDPIEIVDVSATLIHILRLQRNGAMTGKPIVKILESKTND